jgi:hypothetical protein
LGVKILAYVRKAVVIRQKVEHVIVMAEMDHQYCL